MNDLKCLSEQELSEFVEGRIDAARVEQIAEHLEACGDCQSTVVMLGEQSDTFIQQLRAPAVPDALEAEDACQAAVQRLAARVAEGRSEQTASLPAAGQIEQVGPYRIQGQLGVGGMGTVFEAVHTKLKRSVALKLLPASRWANPAAVSRFEREMEVIGQLDHPNIVRASDAGEENGMHYLVMEHVDGLDLSRVVSRVGPLAVDDACEIARQAAIGLQYAHENHLVHRDIKPSNLMLAASGQQRQRAATVKILDLGLALLGDSHAGQDNELTTVGQLMGTLDYMSPEQGMDSHDVDVRADIYSLGATLYKLLTGSAPFATPQYDTLLKKVTALANNPVTPIQQLRSDIPQELASVVDRMLSKDPADRFDTPEDVAAALEPFTHGTDLGSLLSVALEADEPEDISLPPVISSRHLPPKPVALPKGQGPARGTGRWKLVGLLGLPILLALAAAFVIRVATERGELVISAQEEVQIAVFKDGKVVKQLAVSKGENAVTVWSGSYRIELTGQSDELVLSQNAVSIRRGGRVVVHVQQRPKVANNSDMMQMMGSDTMNDMPAMGMGSMSGGFGSSLEGGSAQSVPAEPEPTYDGQSYGNWLAILKTERKPEKLEEAIRAFGALVDRSDEEQAAEAANAIMQIMRRYGSFIIDNGPQGKLVQQGQTVLTRLPPTIIVAAIEKELNEGTSQSRSFSLFVLGPSYSSNSQGVGFNSSDQAIAAEKLASAVEERQAEVTQALLNLPAQEATMIRNYGLGMVINRAMQTNTPLQQVPGLLPNLRSLLDVEKNNDLLETAIQALVIADPDNKLLLPKLLERLATQELHQQSRTAHQLAQLGPRAAPAVKPLMELLSATLKKVKPGDVESDAYAGGHSGLTSGGMGGDLFGNPAVNVCHASIDALGKIGPAAKDALPLLQSLQELARNEPNPAFNFWRNSGELAVERIEGRAPLADPEPDTKEGDSGPGSQGGFF